MARQCNGTAGLTGLDAHAWRCMCTSFKHASWDLCSAIAGVPHHICTKSVDPEGILTLVACCIIPLDKCPEVRPIGVGEVLRRNIRKAVMRIVKEDMLTAAGSMQVCAGLGGGCEVAVHAIRSIFNTDDTERILLMNAANAFNNLNGKAVLNNINYNYICPADLSVSNQDVCVWRG